jgi:hypothetical protein
MASPGEVFDSAYAQLPRSRAQLLPAEAPILLNVLSTEEEFDWAQPFDPGATSVEAAGQLERGQSLFDEFGIRPTYVVDYPIADQSESVGPLKEFQDSGRCEIGAHLHPWVSPPLEEAVSDRNSFPGNLPRELEAAKLKRLTERIEESFGRRPVAYQAGRYGFGPNTAGLLISLGYRVDFSATPPFDFREEGGPDYSSVDCHPTWLGEDRGLLAVPISGAYVGFVRDGAHGLYRTVSGFPLLCSLRLPGILARLGAIDRLRLSPEGFDFQDLRKLTRHLLDQGVRVFVFSFHSPSLMPGCTPYVQSEAELRRFLDRCRRYYDHFLSELGGRVMSTSELYDHLRRNAPPVSP